jgi:DNA repair exonuclease SbcCD ATPase subunit
MAAQLLGNILLLCLQACLHAHQLRQHVESPLSLCCAIPVTRGLIYLSCTSCCACVTINAITVLQASPGAPPDVAQQLANCFTCNYQQTQQELSSLRQQLAEQQRATQHLLERNQRLEDQLAARNSTLAELQQQPTQLERQQEQQQLTMLQQQLAEEQKEKQVAQGQLAQLQQLLQQGAALVTQQLS